MCLRVCIKFDWATVDVHEIVAQVFTFRNKELHVYTQMSRLQAFSHLDQPGPHDRAV
jgi:hypothetical protein